MLNPGAPSYDEILLVVVGLGMLAGLLWLRRITSLDDHTDRSFWRSRRERGWGSWLPDGPELPTRRWLVTRAEMTIAVVALGVALAAPFLLSRWERAFEFDAFVAGALWLVAVALAAVGTRRILMISRGDRDAGSSSWRSRRR